MYRAHLMVLSFLHLRSFCVFSLLCSSTAVDGPIMLVCSIILQPNVLPVSLCKQKMFYHRKKGYLTYHFAFLVLLIDLRVLKGFRNVPNSMLLFESTIGEYIVPT